MNYRLLIYYIFIFCTLLIAGCRQGGQPGEKPSMKASFSQTDKSPLGTYVAYQELQSAFHSYDIELNKKSFKDYFKKYTSEDYSRKGNAFCVFAKQFYPDEEDMESLTDFVSNGNTLLIASNLFNQRFLNKFHLRTSNTFSFEMTQFYDDMSETGVGMKDSARFGRDWYHYFFFPLTGNIYREESYPSLTLTRYKDSMPGGVAFTYGSGRIIAISNATAFTNYFLLTRNNYHYLEQVLSYVPEGVNNFTWDTYYNSSTNNSDNDGNRDDDDSGKFSAFQELMKQEAMRWAFWLTLVLAATWIINGVIRRQRVIEVIKPNTNSSVEFAETIGRLYLLKRDNKNIATKMITYFLEYVRSRYYISTGTLDNHFAQLLTAKSGQPAEKTEELLRTIDRINIRDRIGDLELLELNTLLRQFIR